MAQNRTVQAFRKRMKARGYTEIHITQVKGKPDTYTVYAEEPALHKAVTAQIDSFTMHLRLTGKKRKRKPEQAGKNARDTNQSVTQ